MDCTRGGARVPTFRMDLEISVKYYPKSKRSEVEHSAVEEEYISC